MFRQGKLDGVVESFDAQGKTLSTRRYREGRPIGTWELRSSEGSIVERGDLDDEGTGKVVEFHSDGSVRVEEHYMRGQRHGVWIEYHSSGREARKEVYRDGALESLTRWHDDGKLAERTAYAGHRKNGPTEGYDIQGRMLFRGQHIHGLREGKWELMTVTGRRYEVVYAQGKAIRVGDAK